MKPKICLVHPGHAISTAWMYDGYKKYLELAGCEVLECRTDKLVSFASRIVESSPNKFDGDQGGTSEQWKMHIAQQFMLIRVLECQISKPDVTLVICGKIISPQNYYLFDLLPGNKVVMLTESPYEDSAQSWYSQFYDFAFVNDKYSVPAIGKVVPASYMPHGFDPDIYHPETIDKQYDVSFIGTPFGNRKSILQGLRYADDLNPMIFDSTTYEPEDGSGKMVMFVPPESAANTYHKTRVNLNIHRTETFFGNNEYIANAYSLGPRAFEIAGCGEFQLCDDSRPELVEIFGDTIATYHDGAEVVEAVRYWADSARDTIRRDMAMASYEIAKNHTYQHRADRLVKQLASWYAKSEWLEQETNG